MWKAEPYRLQYLLFLSFFASILLFFEYGDLLATEGGMGLCCIIGNDDYIKFCLRIVLNVAFITCGCWAFACIENTFSVSLLVYWILDLKIFSNAFIANLVVWNVFDSKKKIKKTVNYSKPAGKKQPLLLCLCGLTVILLLLLKCTFFLQGGK